VTVDGALLVGDAAGYYDPFTGEGIYRAFRGARVAAEVLGECFARGSFSTSSMRRYAAVHSREFTPAVWRQRVIEAVISRPGWLGAVAAGMCRSEWAADRLMTSIGDVSRKRSRIMAPPTSPPA
jgi:flavin-dependent dehydrogenase